jgi:tetraprenyl-beta-curcumene synthase
MSQPGRADPTPLTPAQIWALLRAAVRELTWGLHEVTREMRHWRAMAREIPNDAIREDALYALRNKRTHADGAALFSILPRRRDGNLIRLLTAYELILDFLDNLSERHRCEANGRELHRALIDAVDPNRPLADYYRHHPWKEDGGYLCAMVEACRRRCRRLPSYEEIRTAVIEEASRTQALALNHIANPADRDLALKQWAATECSEERDFTWYEVTGAASASLVVLGLLALAARTDVTAADVSETRRAYWPWMSLVAVMLDSFADQDDDAQTGDHSYVAHYPSRQACVKRLCFVVERTCHRVRSLPAGHTHAVVATSMVAMYLSKDGARRGELAKDSHAIVSAGGSLARILVPVLRLWRIVYRHRSA